MELQLKQIKEENRMMELSLSQYAFKQDDNPYFKETETPEFDKSSAIE